jgi:hypothetical protein
MPSTLIISIQQGVGGLHGGRHLPPALLRRLGPGRGKLLLVLALSDGAS